MFIPLSTLFSFLPKRAASGNAFVTAPAPVPAASAARAPRAQCQCQHTANTTPQLQISRAATKAMEEGAKVRVKLKSENAGGGKETAVAEVAGDAAIVAKVREYGGVL